MSSLFPLKKQVNQHFEALGQPLFLFTMFAAELKTHSAGAEIAGIAKIRSASFQTLRLLL